MGRPSAYKPEYAKDVRKLCLLGATDEQIADFFEVDVRTIHNWKKAHPEFLKELRRGKIGADADIANALFRRAKGYSHPAVKIFLSEGQAVEVPYRQHYPPDTLAVRFWLGNRQSEMWRDKRTEDASKPESDELVKQLITAIQNSPKE